MDEVYNLSCTIAIEDQLKVFLDADFHPHTVLLKHLWQETKFNWRSIGYLNI
jgi:hypothetical protein